MTDKETTTKIRRTKDLLEAYCILWDTKRDYQNQYFSKDTLIENIDKPVSITILADGKSVEIGHVTLIKDEYGVFASGKVETSNHKQAGYIDAINSLVDQNIAHFCTSATFKDDERQHVAEDGKILIWPVFDVHITTTPTDPR